MKVKMFNLVLQILALISLGVALIEGNVASMIMASTLLVTIQLEKICDAIEEKREQYECDNNVQGD